MVKFDSDVLAPGEGEEQLHQWVRPFLSHLPLSPSYADRQIPVSRLPFDHGL